MSTFLQLAFPVAISLAMIGIFHFIAYVHIQLLEVDTDENDTETALNF